MKKRVTVIFSLLLAFLLLFSCVTTSAPPEDFILTVIETTDIHGAILPYDFINDKEAASSQAQIYSLVKAERLKTGTEVLLLDNGDFLQGQPIVYYYNFEATDKEHIAARVMNYMGYNASVVGNHDVEAGHDVYDKLIDEFDFPWLAANIIDTASGEPYFEPYTMVEIKGARIAILGMCTPGVPTWLPENLWEGMEFRGMVETAEKWVPIIEEKEEPDLLIGLFHAGTDYTYSGYGETDGLNPNASLLVARDVPGFDIVFTGHDHQTHNETITNSAGEDVLLLGALDDGRTAAVAEVMMDYDEETGEWSVSPVGRIVDGTELPVDPQFAEDFADVKQEIIDYVGKPIGTFTKSINTRDSMFGDSPFVDLIHRIQLELTGADVSFAAPLSSNAEIAEGQVYVRDMFNLYKYENLLYTMEMTGRQIDDFLEYSYGYWFDTMTGPGDHLIHFKRDDDGELIWNERYSSYDTATRYYNYDSAAGIDYVVDVSQPMGEKVMISGFSDGRPFEPDGVYRVAINSYRASGGGGHLTKGAGMDDAAIAANTLTSTDKDLRYYLLKWIEEEGTVTPSALGNWKVVPEAWVEEAAARDYEMIYGK